MAVPSESFLLLCVALLNMAPYTTAAHILVYPYGHCTNSHLLNMEKLTGILVGGGHDITMLIHDKYNKPHVNVDYANVKFLHFTKPENVKVICSFNSMSQYLETPIQEIVQAFYSSSSAFCEAILQDQTLMAKLKNERFDLAIFDAVDPCSQILADYIDVPFVTFHSHGLDTVMPRNPAYLPAMATTFSDDMTLLQRVINTLGYLAQKMVKFSITRKFEELKTKYDINTTISVANTYDRASLKFVLGDFGLDYVGPLEPTTILVGGTIHAPVAPLPEQFQKIMDNSEKGVVLLSFGSLVRYYDPYWRELFAKALALVPYTVLWKYEGPAPDVLPPNVHIFSWLPQQALLRHPKMKAFVTHSGWNSICEGAYNGVPLVGIPLFGDQFFQVKKITDRAKMGVQLDIHTLTATALAESINTVIEEDRFKTNAKRVSDIMKSKPRSQQDEILFWVDYLVNLQGNTRHLLSSASNLSWFQLMLLDVLCVYIAIFALFFRCVRYSVASMMRTMRPNINHSGKLL